MFCLSRRRYCFAGWKVEMKKEVCYTNMNKKKRIMGETGMKYAVKIRSDV